jgi:hypothetical protein
MVRKPRIGRASEADIAFGVLVIAAFQPNGIATFHRLKIRNSKSRPPVELRHCGIDHAPERRDVGAANSEYHCSP